MDKCFPCPSWQFSILLENYSITGAKGGDSLGWVGPFPVLQGTRCVPVRVKELWREWDSNHIRVACSLVNNIVKTTKEIIPQDIDLSFRDQNTTGEGEGVGYWWRIYFRRKVCRLLGKKFQLLFPISCFSVFSPPLLRRAGIIRGPNSPQHSHQQEIF